jgi:hypothetical protein
MKPHNRKPIIRNRTTSNNIYIPFPLCLTSLSLPDMIGQFSQNPGKKQSLRFLIVSEMSRLRHSEITLHTK